MPRFDDLRGRDRQNHRVNTYSTKYTKVIKIQNRLGLEPTTLRKIQTRRRRSKQLSMNYNIFIHSMISILFLLLRKQSSICTSRAFSSVTKNAKEARTNLKHHKNNRSPLEDIRFSNSEENNIRTVAVEFGQLVIGGCLDQTTIS